ncbi:MAG: hypothetical protein U0M60_15970 [Clostridia bacterium]|nr:hypothetical protein [Clostridia bacterium]
MKKITSILIALAMVISTVIAVPVSAETVDGFDGTPATELKGKGDAASPYLISNAAELAYARNQINAGDWKDKTFKLTEDIDYDNQEWEPIGNDTNKFTGIFDGNRHKIMNLKITNGYKYIGVFGFVNMGTVKNLGIENLNISAACTADGAGGIVGYIHYDKSVLSNCYIKDSTIVDSSYGKDHPVGAVVGSIGTNVKIDNCYAYGVDIWNNRGITGCFFGKLNLDGSTITNCYVAKTALKPELGNSANRYGASYAFGYTNGKTATIENCYSAAEDTEGYNGGSADSYSHWLDSAKSAVVTKSATVSQVEAGLVTELEDTVFTTDIHVNGGYPCFKHEACFVLTDVTITSDNKVAVTVTRKAGVTLAPQVYIVSFNENRFITAAIATLDKDTFEFDADVNLDAATKIKVFVWDGMRPVTMSYEEPVSEN